MCLVAWDQHCELWFLLLCGRCPGRGQGSEEVTLLPQGHCPLRSALVRLKGETALDCAQNVSICNIPLDSTVREGCESGLPLHFNQRSQPTCLRSHSQLVVRAQLS